jgi:hypothetical protein
MRRKVRFSEALQDGKGRNWISGRRELELVIWRLIYRTEKDLFSNVSVSRDNFTRLIQSTC